MQEWSPKAPYFLPISEFFCKSTQRSQQGCYQWTYWFFYTSGNSILDQSTKFLLHDWDLEGQRLKVIQSVKSWTFVDVTRERSLSYADLYLGGRHLVTTWNLRTGQQGAQSWGKRGLLCPLRHWIHQSLKPLASQFQEEIPSLLFAVNFTGFSITCHRKSCNW